MFVADHKIRSIVFTVLLVFSITLTSGCSWFGAQAKPQAESEPGKEKELTYTEKIKRPPLVFFDVADQVNEVFKPLNRMDFPGAQDAYKKLKITWEKAKAESGSIQGVKDADEGILALGASLEAAKGPESVANMNQFTNGLSKVLHNYHLSPLNDLVTLETISRNIAWEVEDRDFKKAMVRAEELKKYWGQSKTNFEQPGILSEVTKAHDSVDKVRGAITAENKGLTEDSLKGLDKNLANIRNFYKSKNASKMP